MRRTSEPSFSDAVVHARRRMEDVYLGEVRRPCRRLQRARTGVPVSRSAVVMASHAAPVARPAPPQLRRRHRPRRDVRGRRRGRVRVRHDERVDALDLPRTEERLHQRRARYRSRSREAARVDDDHAAARELDDRGVALPDVEERHARRMRPCARAHHGCVDRQRDEQQAATSRPARRSRNARAADERRRGAPARRRSDTGRRPPPTAMQPTRSDDADAARIGDRRHVERERRERSDAARGARPRAREIATPRSNSGTTTGFATTLTSDDLVEVERRQRRRADQAAVAAASARADPPRAHLRVAGARAEQRSPPPTRTRAGSDTSARRARLDEGNDDRRQRQRASAPRDDRGAPRAPPRRHHEPRGRSRPRSRRGRRSSNAGEQSRRHRELSGVGAEEQRARSPEAPREQAGRARDHDRDVQARTPTARARRRRVNAVRSGGSMPTRRRGRARAARLPRPDASAARSRRAPCARHASSVRAVRDGATRPTRSIVAGSQTDATTCTPRRASVPSTSKPPGFAKFRGRRRRRRRSPSDVASGRPAPSARAHAPRGRCAGHAPATVRTSTQERVVRPPSSAGVPTTVADDAGAQRQRRCATWSGRRGTAPHAPRGTAPANPARQRAPRPASAGRSRAASARSASIPRSGRSRRPRSRPPATTELAGDQRDRDPIDEHTRPTFASPPGRADRRSTRSAQVLLDAASPSRSRCPGPRAAPPVVAARRRLTLPKWRRSSRRRRGPMPGTSSSGERSRARSRSFRW